MNKLSKILVVGASGGSGRNTVKALVSQGYEVTALSRKASEVFSEPVRTIDGSALDERTLKFAIEDQDAVIVTLGISENHIRTRLLGPKKTPMNIRSEGTQKVIKMMHALGVKRLIVQTTYGSGPSSNMLRTIDKLFFDLILRPQIDDTDIQDKLVRDSQLDWTIIQPVHLSDEENATTTIYASSAYDVADWSITREQVGEYNAQIISDPSTVGQTMSLSTAA